MTLSTHVLDAALGRPAAGIAVALEDGAGTLLAKAETDVDGRVTGFAAAVAAGTYRLRFDTGGYFAATQQTGFYPEVVLTFGITDTQQHYHVALLLSPFAYSTYRGS
jgi:5-hydroxyisourate hydrolase